MRLVLPLSSVPLLALLAMSPVPGRLWPVACRPESGPELVARTRRD